MDQAAGHEDFKILKELSQQHDVQMSKFFLLVS